MGRQARRENFDNQREDLVARTRRLYLEAFEDVRVSAVHTATEGWGRVYQGHLSEVKQRRLAVAKVLSAQAETMDVRLLVEDEEKEVKDAIKQNVELRDFETQWEKQVLRPITEPVTRCKEIIENSRAAADREERNAPLVNVGLCQILDDMIATLPRAEWEERTGRVKITGDGSVTHMDDETGG